MTIKSKNKTLTQTFSDAHNILEKYKNMITGQASEKNIIRFIKLSNKKPKRRY